MVDPSLDKIFSMLAIMNSELILAEETDVSIAVIAGTSAITALAVAFILIVVATQKRIRAQQESYQRELLKATIHIQENERKRFAQDLHDDLGAKLSLLRLKIDNEETIFSHSYPEEIKYLVDESIHSTREVSKALSPALLEKFGLSNALYNLAEKATTKATGVYFSNTGLEKRINNNTELALYRIVQEMLVNIIKHGKASRIEVALNIDVSSLALEIKDNGMPFNITDAHQYSLEQAGLGLKNIESRVTMLNAKVFYQRTSDNNNFTRFSVSLNK